MGYSNSSVAALFLVLILSCNQPDKRNVNWDTYRGDKSSTGYSGLDQINKSTVDKLEVAWIYHTGDASEGNRSTIECNPIIVNGLMYITSPQLKLIALDPQSGKVRWKFDPFAGTESTGVNRGVTYWANEDDKRILFSAGPWLYALNAENGALVLSFGDSGRIDLRKGLGRDPAQVYVWASSPGIIYQDLLIQGTGLNEGYGTPPGFIRAFDVKTGKLAWTFHTIPEPGEFGFETWQPSPNEDIGGVNCWGGMSLDEKTGIVYVPLGSPAFDFYGGNRKGENLFGNCLLALDAKTGERKWHYQVVHHDLWDYDLPAPPNLVSVKRGDTVVDAVAQVTKMGTVFLFDRYTGKPLFPIEERTVGKSELIGEVASPTQPFPVKPAPFVRQEFSKQTITNISPEAHANIWDLVKNVQTGGIYTAPSVRGMVQLPGTRGGAEWGGASFDPETNILYVNANEEAMLITMSAMNTETKNTLSAGEKIYAVNNCTMCHGADREGDKVFPALNNLSDRMTEDQAAKVIKSGRGQMPAFPSLSSQDRTELLNFLFDKRNDKGGKKANGEAEKKPTRYVHDGWKPLRDKDGYPGIKPPWGTLNAIDLNSGDLVWQVPLGEYPELLRKGIPVTGTPNIGGCVVTAGGLVMIAATRDEKFRIFDKDNGKLLWQYKLPAGGYAMPSTYSIESKQYIVIAAGGGGKVGSPSGDAYIVFRLKED